MGLNNINFKLLSLNARGIRSFDKRKTIFSWLCKSGADLCFLQETYSSKEVENIWRKQWKGDMFFSNSLIIHAALTQPEHHILVRWMGLETQ